MTGAGAVPPPGDRDGLFERSGLGSLRTGDLTWREVRDIVWLATRLHRSPGQSGRSDEPAHTLPTDDPSSAVTSETTPGGGERRRHRDQTTTRETSTAEPDRFLRAIGVHAEAGGSAATSRWPAAPALPQAREIARALRPLMRTSPSPWDRALNEEATAIRAAEDGMWLPVWQPVPWHRLELTLVVDIAPSMEIWHPTVNEFRNLARRQGAFRNVRTFLFDGSRPSNGPLRLRVEGSARATYHPDDLTDPTGRRLVLVMTDAIGTSWRDGTAQEMLVGWTATMPVAVLHVLPQRLWTWGGLSPSRMRLSASTPAAPNRALRVRHRGLGEEGADQPVGDAVPVPVLGLSKEWLAGWAQLVSTGGSVETTAVLARRRDRRQPPPDTEQTPPAPELTPREQVLQFRTYASPSAFQLAGLLAAAPLNFPMMRLVHRVLLPGAGLSVLAEVLLGNLLRRLPGTERSIDPTQVTFDFRDGIRAELLASGRRDTTVLVPRVLDDLAGEKIPALRNYRASVDDPDTADRLFPSRENVPYLRVQEAVLRALSGRYLPRAKQLEVDLQQTAWTGGHLGARPYSAGHGEGSGTSAGRRSGSGPTFASNRRKHERVAGSTFSSRGEEAVTNPLSRHRARTSRVHEFGPRSGARSRCAIPTSSAESNCSNNSGTGSCKPGVRPRSCPRPSTAWAASESRRQWWNTSTGTPTSTT